MTFKTPKNLWQDYSDAAIAIRERFGSNAAIDYLLGEKLMTFAQTGETEPAFLAELPAFADRIRSLFSAADMENYFVRADHAARIDPDLLQDATPEEIEEFQSVIDDARRDRERRAWVKAMLLKRST